MDALNETLVDYTVTLDLGPSVGRYMFFLELTPSGKEFNENSKIQDILEKHLFETNPRYQAGIKEKRISPCVVRLVQPGTFQKIRYELIKRGASLNRVKIPRLIRDAQLMEMLNNNCLK
jgi:hypothetical protein